jgi:hypothetical protein
MGFDIYGVQAAKDRKTHKTSDALRGMGRLCGLDVAEWPYPPDFGDAYGDHEPDDIVCKVCKTPDLRWVDLDGRWVLHEEDGSVHKCPEVHAEYVFDPVHGLRKKGER